MKPILKTVSAGVAGLLALGVTAAMAEKSPRGDDDDRAYHADYYDNYEKERAKRTRAHRSGSGVSLTVRVGDDRYYRDRRYRDRYYDDRRRGRVLKRQVYDTRHRARIVLTEEIRYGRRGHPRLVCTVRARGPERDYVSVRRMNRIANRECSRRARVRVLA